MKIKILDGKTSKKLISKNYNFVFNKLTGAFSRWGKDFDDDPDFGLPEIADIEVTTICAGVKGKPCSFCYKSNTPNGKNMSLDTFKTIFAKLPKSVTQIAFGADASATSNPDLFAMMQYCRDNGVVPNITVADISEKTAKQLTKLCGAVSVSYYNKTSCYGSVKRLIDAGLKQCNIHCLISEETYFDAIELLNDIKIDPRLRGLNAVVFLALKQKGRGSSFTPLANDKFNDLVSKALDAKIGFGFDSCSCSKFLESVKDHENFSRFSMLSEPCESLCFSMYCNVDGHFFPCSFTEGEGDWKEGIDLTVVDDFLKEVWFVDKVIACRNLIVAARKAKKSCFYFDV